jgi:hypothetical protein
MLALIDRHSGLGGPALPLAAPGPVVVGQHQQVALTQPQAVSSLFSNPSRSIFWKGRLANGREQPAARTPLPSFRPNSTADAMMADWEDESENEDEDEDEGLAWPI